MSVDVFRPLKFDAIPNAVEIEEIHTVRVADEWSPEQFAHEQIRGLVRQVFFSSAAQPVRQVVFSAVDARTDVSQICRQIGEALAWETKSSVAVLSRALPALETSGQKDVRQEIIRPRAIDPGPLPLRDMARRIRSNLWLLTEGQVLESREKVTALYSRLCELRAEFDYSIVEGPPAGLASEAAALGQLADGLVLVLAAHKTRRAAARKIKETLEAARTRILGTVLSERTFPIPSALYRRL
jgi:hypothetical protein